MKQTTIKRSIVALVFVSSMFLLNTLGHWYLEATTAEVREMVRLLGRTMLAGSLFGVLFGLIMLAALALAYRKAPKLEEKTRREINKATED